MSKISGNKNIIDDINQCFTKNLISSKFNFSFRAILKLTVNIQTTSVQPHKDYTIFQIKQKSNLTKIRDTCLI